MNKRNGHTFLELILAVSIAGLVLAALSSGLNLGLRVYERTRDHVAGEAQSLFDQLSRDLRSAFLPLEQDGSLAFIGSPQSLRFVATRPLNKALGQGETDLRRIRYFLLPTEQAGLSRWVMSEQATALSQEGENDAPSTVLSANVKSLKMSFFDGQQWLDFWSSTESLPAAVSFSVTLDSGSKKQPGETFLTVVDIPVR